MTKLDLAAACVVVALSTSGSARAEGESSLGGLLHLTWTAPAECPTQARVAAHVADLLGGPTEAASHVRASARVWRDENARWHVEIHTQTGPATGERRVDGESCQAIADATALILAVAVDPEAVAARAAPKRVPETASWDPANVPPSVVVAPGPVVGTALPLPAVPAPSPPKVPVPMHGAIVLMAGLDAGTLLIENVVTLRQAENERATQFPTCLREFIGGEHTMKDRIVGPCERFRWVHHGDLASVACRSDVPALPFARSGSILLDKESRRSRSCHRCGA
jgi:hypothetical protein